MASKFGFAGGVPERRVRPVWDAVDSRQYKTALKLCVALLAKHPSSPYVLALKALILERMGKGEEALTICLNAKDLLDSNNVIHIDDLTLNTLQIVFQRLDRLDLATSCYEFACGKYPNNLEILMGLFNCYVREYSFVKQQQTAIKMYKIVAEERFLLWAVCSIQLQVFCSNGGEKLLSLAEALIKKHIASHSLHEPEALLVYISILEQQAKYKAALDILSGNLGSLIGIEADKLRMQGRLLARTCDYAAAAETFARVLESCPDDWESFLHYLGSSLEEDMNWSKTPSTEPSSSPSIVEYNSCKSTHLTDDMFDSRMSNALSFLHKLQMDVKNESMRCPYLAVAEIEHRRCLKGRLEDGKLMEVILNYICRFSHLPCCASDIKKFICILTESEKASLLEKISRIPKPSTTTPLMLLGHAMTVFRIQDLFGVKFSLSVVELEGTAIRIVETFCKYLALSRDLDPQENMHGEDLLCMASNVLVQLFWRTKNLGYLLEAILVLEFGLTVHRHVWQYKILLLHMYSHLQALPIAFEWYRTLEVKNVMLETVLHHILPQMLKSALMTQTSDLLKDYLKFMNDYLREAADYTFLAYRHRNYSKVIEFVQFKERLQHSGQYLMARLDASIIHLRQKADGLEDIECVLENSNHGIQLLDLANEEKLRSLTFNEDLQTRPWWSPTSNVNYLSEPFEGGAAHLREKLCKPQTVENMGLVMSTIERKSLLPRLIYLSVQAASACLKENAESCGSLSDRNNSDELKLLLERYARNIKLSYDDAVEVIVGIAKGQKPFKDFRSDMVYWINFAVFFNALSLSSHHVKSLNGEACNLSSWYIVDSLIDKCISEQLMSTQPLLTNPGNDLATLVQLVSESLSWHVLVIQSCVRSILPSGKKKKKTAAVDQLSSSQLQAIHGSIQCSRNAIQLVRKWLGDQISRTEEQSVDILLSHLRTSASEGGGPGRALEVLEQECSSHSDLGDRISSAVQSWSSATVVRVIVVAQRTELIELQRMCDSKIKLLDSLKHSI